MFHLGHLIVLCSLLVGTSSSLSEAIDSILKNVGSLNSLLANFSDFNITFPTIDGVSQIHRRATDSQVDTDTDILQNRSLTIRSLQETIAWSLAKDRILEGLKTLDLGTLNPKLRLQIKEPRILEPKLDLSSSGDDITLRMPVVLVVSVRVLPSLTSMAEITISMEIISSFLTQNDAKSDLPVLAMQQCSSDMDKISISIWGSQSAGETRGKLYLKRTDRRRMPLRPCWYGKCLSYLSIVMKK
uniref:Lipid-binding serum glycoprotein N-terminal domain-containing protein n=1 Tax=Mus spicilegus TaxID=10103 RepID=A0A8C6HLE6_MUSSI